jgi:hypothetical protein
MSPRPSSTLTRILAVVVLISGAIVPATASAATVGHHRHKVTNTFTAHVLGVHDSPALPSDPDCYGSQSTEITITGRPSNWHLRLHQSDWFSCSSCEYTTDANEDLGPGEFGMSKSLRSARLDADVTLDFGCPEGGSAPAHISAAWSGRGKVTTEVSTSRQDRRRTRTLTKTRFANFALAGTTTLEWPANQPPRGYLRFERTYER